MKTERVRVYFYNVELGRNSLKEDRIVGEDMNIQPKSFHQRGSAHVYLTVASLMSTIQPPFLEVY